MKKSKNIFISSIFIVSIITSCSTNLNNIHPNNSLTEQIKIKNLKIEGKVDFPQNTEALKIKSTLKEVASDSTISLIYPHDHKTSANKTIATGLTDSNGNFTLNLEQSFNLNINDIFILESTKRIGGVGNSIISLRTYIKWLGNGWTSITKNKIYINSKTTALSAMSSLISPSISSSDIMETINVSDGIVISSDIKNANGIIIHSESINDVSKIVDEALLISYDPLQNLVYKNGLFSVKNPIPKNNLITTIAGNGNKVWLGDNYSATNSALNSPNEFTFDNKGNLYIVDTNNYRIRKIDTNSIITTVAGNGVGGFNGDNIKATDAKLLSIKSIASDTTGNLYITDYSRVRKIDTNGIITTIAGTGVSGYSGDNGKAILSKINQPLGVTLDSLGNIYIADTNNYRIRKIDTNGIIKTIAGSGIAIPFSDKEGNNGPALASKISPTSIVVDKLGNLYITDTYNHEIRKIDTNGIIKTIIGDGRVGSGYSGDNGKAIDARLSFPKSLSIDNIGNLYISDSINNRIRKVDTNDIITTIAGNGASGYIGDNGKAIDARLNGPTLGKIDKEGNLYISDTYNNRIRKVDINGIITTISGGSIGDNIKANESILFSPNSLSTDSSGNMYISDTENNKIRKVDINGIITTIAGNGIEPTGISNIPAVSTLFYKPMGIFVDKNNNIYIADSGNNRIRKIDTNGIITTFAGSDKLVNNGYLGNFGYSGDNGKATEAKLYNPSSFFMDSIGNSYISDTNNHRIRKIDTKGIITTIAGTGISGYSGDNGKATEAKINSPKGITSDKDGNLYIADTNNHRVRKIDINGIITTIAGTGTAAYGYDDIKATLSMLNIPSSVIVDNIGNLYIADSGNNRIRKVDINGIISTVIGINSSYLGNAGYSGDNSLAISAKLNNPQGLNIDNIGNLYVADSGNNRIRKISNISIKP